MLEILFVPLFQIGFYVTFSDGGNFSSPREVFLHSHKVDATSRVFVDLQCTFDENLEVGLHSMVSFDQRSCFVGRQGSVRNQTYMRYVMCA